ncbi:hypothetical protein AB0D49_28665 [Streptomyces sp. NPDC048290]|uniref:hypothetical protein n=1 Tax=Streptomyces sp. NPDC048290 TaxID=3155811 RepID=UPI0034415E41
MTPRSDAAEVPLAWLCAQDSASRLLAHGQPLWSQASFEYRAAHDVLALTLLFTCPPGASPGFTPADLGAMHARVADDVEWALWCHAHLDAGTWSLAPADWTLARVAFRWLESSRLLGGSPDATLGICAATATRHGAGVSVGVTLARRMLDPWAYQYQPGQGADAE